MLLLTHIFTFIFVLFVLLLNIRSLVDEDKIEFISDFQLFNDHDKSFFSPYSRIHLKQQLKSRLPNINEPLRDLRIGKLNFLHTTDTHGWYLGHLNQRQYSSDWGDFISFHTNLQANINQQGSDLLLIDSGDRHDGNGLSDLTPVNGELSSKIFMMLDYDLITVGNHELYNAEISKLEYETLVPRYGDHFISTNVQYKNDDDEWVIFGNNTHRYFETKVNKYKILSFSFLFDFKMGNSRVNVTPINDIITQSWFLDLVKDYSENYEIDTIIIFGHLPVANEWYELKVLHDFLRSYFPDIYIQYLGGHSHIRDFSIYDNYSTGIQSGRYCETAGFLAIDELPKDFSISENENFVTDSVHRRYIDFNLHSFMYHTNHTILDNFNTEKGLFVSKELAKYNKDLELDEVYGTVPHSYYISAADYTKKDDKSLLSFLEDEVLVQLKPKSCNDNNNIVEGSDDNDRIILINTGGIRYDLYKGEFNKNSLFTVSPFKNMWRILPSVSTEIAMKIQTILNNDDFIINNQRLKSSYQIAIDAKYTQPQSQITNINNDDNINDDTNDNAVFTVLNSNLYRQLKSKTTTVNPNGNNANTNEDKDYRLPLSYGYTTIDDFGIHGDDTIHKKLRSYYVPNVIQSHEFSSKNSKISSEFTDVVYYDFIEPFVLNALKEACNGDDQLFERLSSDASYYNDCPKEDNLGQLLKNYAISNWN